MNRLAPAAYKSESRQYREAAARGTNTADSKKFGISEQLNPVTEQVDVKGKRTGENSESSISEQY